MFSYKRVPGAPLRALALSASASFFCAPGVLAQQVEQQRSSVDSSIQVVERGLLAPANISQPRPAESPALSAGPALIPYYDPVQGTSSIDLVRRALTANGELSAARLDVERSRARLRQSGLRPNPTLDFEQTTGRFTGSPGNSQTSIGIALPLELGGK
jgi:outer membrane protein TolC